MILYSRIKDHETVCELWGASTKHPDSINYYSDFKKSDCADDSHPLNIFAWLLQIASNMWFLPNTIKVMEEARHMIRDYFLYSDGDLKAYEIFAMGD